MAIDDHFTISNGRVMATIKADGAELCSLKNADGYEVLWQAGPEWPRHAPILFPIVGRLKDDVLRHGGKTYPMTQHGFARDQLFAWTAREKTLCVLSLSDNEASRAKYPFAFRLDVSYVVDEDELVIGYAITNTGDEMLPASIGAHPAFHWPLADGIAKTAHRIVFAQPEPAPIRRLDGGLLLPQPEATAVQGDTLALSEALFAADAMIFDRIASTSLRYEAPGAPTITFAWDGFPQLGIWSKPSGAAFLCIEPWHGFASAVDFDGEFSDKPGVMQIAVGETRSFTQRIGFA
ncbi:aldose 1-epimerase family protein [Tardiphaga alba]|uniref:Aldose 1-epimerase family protein n=1 Tax=Tardiphaga alba TaxID=340268 RepID=A0ABX8AB61_9BRAD|nr:aldose 1-epimerase family protein [Tardiphaga alba]QUS41009.1 aldose 1-epimerase family protein [Tardiphaga alba]